MSALELFLSNLEKSEISERSSYETALIEELRDLAKRGLLGGMKPELWVDLEPGSGDEPKRCKYLLCSVGTDL